MTTPAGGGSGWNGDDQSDPDWSDDPLYEDSGWHPNPADPYSDGPPTRQYRAAPPRPGDPPFRYPDQYRGNGESAADPRPNGRAAERGRQQDRTSGRHRRARPDEQLPPAQPRGDRRPSRPGRDYPPAPPPAGYPEQPGYQDRRGQYRSAPDRGGRRDYQDPLREAMYPPPADPRERPGNRDPYDQRGYSGDPRYPDRRRSPGPPPPPDRRRSPSPPAYSDRRGPLAPAPPDRRRPPSPPAYSDRRGVLPPDYSDLYGPPTSPGFYLPPDVASAPVRNRPPQRPTKALPLMPTRPRARARGQLDGTAEPATGSFSIVKSSSVMAVGTLASRLTGFLRTIAQSYALGALGIAAAYNLANTLPNVVYNLALGGILTSVIVPLIVNAGKRDSDRGAGYDQRMFTLITLSLLGITLVATIAAAPLAHLYTGSSVARYPGAAHLTVIFAYFFIPQIFFYGVSSLIGAILNSRGSFAAPMWTPIINNFVVIAVLGMYVAVAGLHKSPTSISPTQVQLLGLGTTLGIVAQTVALIPALRRVGFRWHPQLDFRRSEAAEIGRMGGWMFGYIGATQVAFLVTTKLAGDAGVQGVTYYNYAWLLFQLPYAVVGISVITALLPRMSSHASDGRFALVREDFSTGIRLASTIVVPCSLVLAALGPALAVTFFAHGATTTPQAHEIGVVFAVFCLGLLPFMIFQLQLRVFYSLHDSKTPALIGFATMTLNIVANLVAWAALPTGQLVAGLGVGFGLANLLGVIVAWSILSRRLRGLDGRAVSGTLIKMYAASVPAALLAVLAGMLVDGFVSGPRSAAFITVVIGGGGALLVYLLFARALQVRELSSVTRSLLSKFGR